MNEAPKKSSLTQAEYFKDIVGTVREPLLVLDGDLRVLAANRSFYTFFKVKQKDTLGKPIYALGNHQWDIPGLRLLLETILPKKAVFNDYNVEHDFPFIGRRSLRLNARRIPAPPKTAQWILLAFEDVTERMALEQTLQASEERFRLAFETATDNMLLVDKTSGRVLNSNRAAQHTFHYSKQKLLKMNLWEIGILKDRQQFEQVSEELERKGAVEILNSIIRIRMGGDSPAKSTRDFPAKSTRGFPADVYLMDKAAVIQCNIRDITERKQAEEKLGASENELRALFSAMTDAVFVLDGDGRYLKIAPTNPTNLYRPAEDMLGKTVYEVLPKDQADFILAKIGQAIQTSQTIQGEYALQIDGKEIWFESSTSRLTENSVFWVAHDITERKRAEQALQQSEEKFRMSFMTSMDAFYIARMRDGQLIEANDTFEEIFGYSRQEAIGKTSLELGLFADRKDRDRLVAELKSTGWVKEREMESRKKNGQEITVAVSASLIQIENQPHVLGMMRDITEHKRAEEQLKEYSDHLGEMVEERTRELREAQEQLVRKEKLAVLGTLAGGMGHELRNPLGVISNSVYYLNMVQPEANEKIRKHLGIIEQEVHNAARIVGDLLDYARVISTDPEPASVRALVENTLSRFPAPASIRVSLRIPANLPSVYADPLHVEQMLGNLVTNACQAMVQGGKLAISARRLDHMVAIAVKDTGTGVTPENMQSLFEPLFSTKVTGIGLGLAVSKKLAEANGGRIEVESEYGKGSTFTLVLPIKGGE
ncbi:MAG: PAS domain S-box protein [Anaerolineales bacterium]